MKKITINIMKWIGDDYRSHPFRFAVEMLAWALSIGGAVLFAFTVPNVPFLLYLTITITVNKIKNDERKKTVNILFL
jgi:hypothetical protein